MDRGEREGTNPTPGRPMLWVARAAWVAQALAVGAYGSALDGRSGAVRGTVAIGLWAGWGAVLVALLVPAVATLTVVRLAVPAAVVTAGWALLAGADGWSGMLALGLAVVCTLATFSGDVGEQFVQASAYGAERRLLLRPPPAWVVLAAITWVVIAGGVLVGPVLVAAGRWWLGLPVAAVGVFVGWQGGTRVHRLSRRWLVYVPAGVVVHDHVVLADAHLFRVIDVAAIRLAPRDSAAADFTGGAFGPAVEIELRELATMVLAPTPAEPRGRALHVRTMQISPTRPGRALALAAAGRLPLA